MDLVHKNYCLSLQKEIHLLVNLERKHLVTELLILNNGAILHS